MRLGIFGGTFDPIHYGHLLLAECCREQCELDRVWFVPAAIPPHKQARDVSSAEQRIEMLQLAVGGHAAFEVSRLEVDRGGLSYTAETLAAVAGQAPDAQLFFLMGADSLSELPTWREPARVCQLATVIVVRRPGSPPPDFDCLAELVPADRLEAMRQAQVEMPLVDLRSSDLRAQVAAGRSIRYRTPRAVEEYIRSHGLYGV